MKPEIKAGQEWEKAHNDGPSSKPTCLRVLEVMHNRVKVGTVRPDGTTFRHREILRSALSNTASGYMLVKDVGPTTERASPEVMDAMRSLLEVTP